MKKKKKVFVHDDRECVCDVYGGGKGSKSSSRPRDPNANDP